MVTRLFLVYLIVELAALVVLVSAIGFGRTALVLLIAFVFGIALAGSQARRQLARLGCGVNSRPGGHNPVSDGALIALGTLLVVVPGLVTTAAGLLLLVPATRTVARPVLAGLAVGHLSRRAPLITTVTARRYATRRRDDFADGEVIDVVEVEPAALPVDRSDRTSTR